MICNYNDSRTEPLGLDLTSEILVMTQLCVTAQSLTGAEEMLSTLEYFSALFRCRTLLKSFIMVMGDGRLKKCVGI